VTVSTTSCLIALEAIGRLDLLPRIYQDFLITPAVASEWAAPTFPWLTVQALRSQTLAQALRLQLGAGEAEAISLAVEVSAARLILDDQRARRVPANLKLMVTGTIGIILGAKQRGFLPLVHPVLDDLRTSGFWLSDALYQQALHVAGE
jgi:uncharacterized protein